MPVRFSVVGGIEQRLRPIGHSNQLEAPRPIDVHETALDGVSRQRNRDRVFCGFEKTNGDQRVLNLVLAAQAQITGP